MRAWLKFGLMILSLIMLGWLLLIIQMYIGKQSSYEAGQSLGSVRLIFSVMISLAIILTNCIMWLFYDDNKIIQTWTSPLIPNEIIIDGLIISVSHYLENLEFESVSDFKITISNATIPFVEQYISGGWSFKPRLLK